MADWLDDHDGKHRYGVRFPSDGKIYGSRECFECTWPDLLAEIERLRSALRTIGYGPPDEGDKLQLLNLFVDTARAALKEKTDG
jgi:hypothetical protein